MTTKKTTPIKITDTTLRDAQQSIWASHIQGEELTKLLHNLDGIGFNSLEVWGGGTFENALRFWKEDPWQRLKLIGQEIKHTPLQMLLRGQNVVGYHSYPDDVLEAFIKQAIDFGISIIRTFDALNDIRNIQKSLEFTKKHGAHAQGTICYTISPHYDIDFFVDYAKKLKKFGADSIAIKDAAGILTPDVAKKLIPRLKKEVKLPIQLHCHITNHTVMITYYEAIKAGVDIIDCTMSQLALTVAQPSTESIMRILENSDYYPKKLNKKNMHLVSHKLFELCRWDETELTGLPLSDDSIFSHQLPRGAYRFLSEQLKKRNSSEKLIEVLEEIPRVRKDLGDPPLFIPISQIIVPQAVYNVLLGKRYQLVPRQIKDYARGLYGKVPGKIAPEILKVAKEAGKIIEERPADLLPPSIETAKAKLDKKLVKTKTDYLSYALFPGLALDFFKWRDLPEAARENIDKEIAPEEEILMLNKLMQEKKIVEFELNENDQYVLIKRQSEEQTASHPMLHHTPIQSEPQKQETAEQEEEQYEKITSPITGIFYGQASPTSPSYVKIGDTVNQGQTVCLIEAMKVMNEIKAPFNCKIVKPNVENKMSVTPQQALFLVEKI